MIRRGGPEVCNETHITKLHRINLVERPQNMLQAPQTVVQGENVIILEWPSFSLDLDPIRNVWGCIKDNINHKYLRNIEKLMRD